MTHKNNKRLIAVALLLLLLLIACGMGIGAVRIPPRALLSIFAKYAGTGITPVHSEVQESVLLAIRMPRVLLGVLVGASLASAGAAMQGLFRNPLADPGLIGVSSGASLAAVVAIMSGAHFANVAGMSALSLITFTGALITAVIVYRISRVKGKTVVSTLLLAGVAINALAGAGTGMFTYAANDAQLRSITFWMLGSLGGATWTQVAGILPFTLIPVFAFPLMAKQLNALSLDEANAAHLGVPVERVKRQIILLSACCVGASVSVSGVISFVGLVVPHIIRMSAGPDHRTLLILSPIIGSALLVFADLFARTAFSPAELPIGVVTALIGAPVLLYIVTKEIKSRIPF